ncbi:hypothetical protein HMN09_00125600 [Mycena chlorophos]|uniref:DUF6534 domain-containing protein n=1 Tax=Mycena chlorophos TaxID=658473 RepID=A0A8H6WN41_MYCCL|nr:hypothetical protein HMN09_00125600 [Mycena chlorophos]
MDVEIGQLTIPLFVGTLMNWFLLGALLVNGYFYFLAFATDQRVNKIIVAFVLVAELLETFIDTRNTIGTFGADWGDMNELDLVGWAWFSVPVVGALIACLGQIFFAWRIHIIGNKTLVVPVVIGVLAVFEFGAGLWTGVLINRAGRYSLLTYEAMKPPVAWLSATAAVDLIIVSATIYYLLKARQPGFRGATYAAINRIIKVTVETGVPCAVFAMVDLALFVKYNGNNYHLGTCIWLSKVYSLSIIIILNSRMSLTHDAGSFEASVNLNVSDLRFGTQPATAGLHSQRLTLQLQASTGSITSESLETRRRSKEGELEAGCGVHTGMPVEGPVRREKELHPGGFVA